MKENNTNNEVFIPVKAGKKQRIAQLFSNGIPGLLLVISVIGNKPETVGALVLNAFCFLSGILVCFFSVRQYKNHGQPNVSRADMVTVFTGLLLIAQGSLIFDAIKGFQPAHMYFIAAAIMIFKGVMFSESKIRRGFIITPGEVTYASGPFRKKVKLSSSYLSDIAASGTKIIFRYNDDKTTQVKVPGSEGTIELAEALKHELLIKKHDQAKIKDFPKENLSS